MCFQSVLDGSIKRGEISNMRSKRWLSGEIMVYGIPEGKAVDFLQQRGFTNILDADSKYLHETYFKGKNSKRTVAYGYAIVSGEVI